MSVIKKIFYWATIVCFIVSSIGSSHAIGNTTEKRPETTLSIPSKFSGIVDSILGISPDHREYISHIEAQAYLILRMAWIGLIEDPGPEWSNSININWMLDTLYIPDNEYAKYGKMLEVIRPPRLNPETKHIEIDIQATDPSETKKQVFTIIFSGTSLKDITDETKIEVIPWDTETENPPDKRPDSINRMTKTEETAVEGYEEAWIGMKREDASVDPNIAVGTVPFTAVGIAHVLDLISKGSVSIFVDRQSHTVLGAQIEGPHSKKLIRVIAMAVRLGTKAEDLASMVYSHPTLPEAIGEAADRAVMNLSVPTLPEVPPAGKIKEKTAYDADVVVIGAGPAGYVAALRAAQLGQKVILIEKDKKGLGGTCLKRGCIPTKIILEALKHEGSQDFVLSEIQARIDNVLTVLDGGIRNQLINSGVRIITAEVNFENSKLGWTGFAEGSDEPIEYTPRIVFKKKRGKQRKNLWSEKVILATGSRPAELRGLPTDGEKIINSDHALDLLHSGNIPEKLTIVGAGAIGLEFASIFNGLGCNVTVVEKEAQICPGVLDKDVAKGLQNKLWQSGITFKLGTTLDPDRIHPGEGSKVLIAIGRKLNTEGLENSGIVLDEGGAILVNEKCQVERKGETISTRVFAIGDITGKQLLAHKGSHEGIVAAEAASGYKIHSLLDYDQIPSVTFTSPEVASVGLTEDAAREGFIDVEAKFFWTGDGENFLKVILDKERKTLLGAVIIGLGAPYAIAELTLAIKKDATLDVLMQEGSSFYAAIPTKASNWFDIDTVYPYNVSPLLKEHERLGCEAWAEFAGTKMPTEYTSIEEEHMATREKAGLFDITHMRSLKVEGKDALDFLKYVTTNNPGHLRTGDSQYSLLADEEGNILDDIWVYRMGKDSYMLFVNASNAEKDYNHLIANAREKFDFDNNKNLNIKDLRNAGEESKVSIALQGPFADRILQPIADFTLAGLGQQKIAAIDLLLNGKRVEAWVSRTGYTGEDGFEIFIHPDHVSSLWRKLLEIGRPLGLLPAGLGARDSLRMEAGFPLYGHEWQEENGPTPFEVGYGWAVDLKGDRDFLGKGALSDQKNNVKQKLVTIVVEEHYKKDKTEETKPLRKPHADHEKGEFSKVLTTRRKHIGHVTSSAESFWLGKPSALAIVDIEYAAPGTTVKIPIGDDMYLGKVVQTPIRKINDRAAYYITNTEEEKAEMLDEINEMRKRQKKPLLSSARHLFRVISQAVRRSYNAVCDIKGIRRKSPDDFFRKVLDLPPRLRRDALIRHFEKLSRKNKNLTELTSFLGAGNYHYDIPAIVDRIASNRGFYTTYTPYQPEISQGNLKVFYLFQSLIARLTGMEVANASLYDGSTALAEAMLMAHRVTETKTRGDRKKVLLVNPLNPRHRAVLDTYAKDMGLEIVTLPFNKSTMTADLDGIRDYMDAHGNDVSSIIIQQPNFLGALEIQAGEIAKLAHKRKSLFIVHVNDPHDLATMRPPGEYGADIVTSEGQTLGNPLYFGGPGLGILATREKYHNQMPGRIIGKTTDDTGKEGFMLLKGTREQHIARYGATSNICTNNALCAVRATAYLMSMGEEGLVRAQETSRKLSAKLAYLLSALPGFNLLAEDRVSSSEVAFRVSEEIDIETLNKKLLEKDILNGLNVTEHFDQEDGSILLFSLTNMNTEEDIDKLIDAILETLNFKEQILRNIAERVQIKRGDWQQGSGKIIKETFSHIPDTMLRQNPLDIPARSDDELYEIFWKLANMNHDMDKGPYFLGSCTMKHNPRRNEEIASLPGFAHLHPLQPASTVQGVLEVLHEFKTSLVKILGMRDATLQPTAGAHGELTALKMFRAYHDKKHKKQPRDIILTTDSAHGTNPASVKMAGMKIVPIASDPKTGYVNIRDLKDKIKTYDKRIAGIMLTIPNTLGLFEPRTPEIAQLIHEIDGLVYMDGANLNAILGQVRPGDLGVDAIHVNPHKTFSTPHGGGGPGSGPVAVSRKLVRFLPKPAIKHNDTQTATALSYELDYMLPYSIGSVATNYGNVGVLLKAAAYLRSLGSTGLAKVSENAVLNANYLMARFTKRPDLFKIDHSPDELRMHELVVAPAQDIQAKGITAMDIAKNLLDYGVHPPTTSFPMIVDNALLIEPTETASKRDLDIFADALIAVMEDAKIAQKTEEEAAAVIAAMKEEESDQEDNNYDTSTQQDDAETSETPEDLRKHTIEEFQNAPYKAHVGRLDQSKANDELDVKTKDIKGFLDGILAETGAIDEETRRKAKRERVKFINRDLTDYYFTKHDEWAKIEDEQDDNYIVSVGLSRHAARLLCGTTGRNIVSIILSGGLGTHITQGKEFGELDSVKAVSDLYMPVSGKIYETNTNLLELINTADKQEQKKKTGSKLLLSDTHGAGWILKIEVAKKDWEIALKSLMTLDQYERHNKGESELADIIPETDRDEGTAKDTATPEPGDKTGKAPKPFARDKISSPVSRRKTPSVSSLIPKGSFDNINNLFSRLAPVLKGYPIIANIEARLIPEVDAEENMKTLARIVALHNSFGFEVHYKFNPAKGDWEYAESLKRMLVEKIEELGRKKEGIDVKRLTALVSGKAPETDLTPFNLHIMQDQTLRNMTEFDDNMLIVAMTDGRPGDGVLLRDFSSAMAIGLAQAAVKKAMMDDVADPDDKSRTYRVLAIASPFVKRIYEKLLPNERIFVQDILAKMAYNGAWDTKRKILLRLALPPLTRRQVEDLRKYHERNQTILEQA